MNIDHAATPLTAAYRTMLRLDGTSLDDAVDAACTLTGPSRDVLRKRIEFRRRHRHLLHPTPEAGDGDV